MMSAMGQSWSFNNISDTSTLHPWRLVDAGHSGLPTFYAQWVSVRALRDDPDRYSQTTDFQQSRPICREGCSGPIDRSAKKPDRFEAGIGWFPGKDVPLSHRA